MGKRAIRIFLVALIMVLPLWGMELGSGAGVHGGRRPAYAPGQLLVKYKPALRAAAADYARKRWGVSTLHTFREIGVHHVKLPVDMTVEEALVLYRSDPDVEYVEPNYYRHVTAPPDDTDYGLLWALHNTGQTICPPKGTVCPPFPLCVTGTPGADIDALAAWDTPATDCTNVTVAIIDTGADYNHRDLAGNVLLSLSRDFVDNDDSPMDPHGHGTHVAGTIAAVGNNAQGVTGVCWTGNLLILRAFDAFGFATLSDILSAMAYARTNDAKVINASYAGGDFSQSERDEISLCNGAGILFVAAAGNEGTDNDATPSYPASYNLPNVIAVAASAQNDQLACFSNYGQNSVDVAAPGTYIYSTKPGRATAWSDDFDDNGISGWTVDAPWDLSTNAYSGSYSLAFVPGGSGATKGDRSARPTTAFDLSGKTGVQLTFKFTGEIPSGDRLFVETAPSASGPWTNRPVLVNDAELFENGISGTAGGWLDAVVDLGAADGVSGLFFRFRYHAKEESSSGGGGGSGGGLCFISTVAFPLSLQGILDPATALAAGAVYIDDVQITTAGDEDVYQYLSGTSMATPHVVGLAALVWSQAPTPLTANEVKARILNSVERLTSLARQVVTWGRINASRSIANVPAEPVGLAATARSSSRIDLSWANTYYGQIGFRIERKEGAGGTFTQIAELGMGTNNTSYNDSNGLSTGRTYYYRVRAYYSGGNVSGYSAEAAATTL